MLTRSGPIGRVPPIEKLFWVEMPLVMALAIGLGISVSGWRTGAGVNRIICIVAGAFFGSCIFVYAISKFVGDY